MENNEVEETYIEQILDEIEDSLKKDTSLDNILSGVYQKIVLKIGVQPHGPFRPGLFAFVFVLATRPRARTGGLFALVPAPTAASVEPRRKTVLEVAVLAEKK